MEARKEYVLLIINLRKMFYIKKIFFILSFSHFIIKKKKQKKMKRKFSFYDFISILLCEATRQKAKIYRN